MKMRIAALAALLGVGFACAANGQDLFRAEEVNLIGYGDWIDRQTDQWGGGIGLNYFLSRNIGIGASTHLENFDGPFIDNLAGELYLRMPLGRLPIAPYAVGTGGYSWDHERWFVGGGGGAEWRFTKAFGVFGDVQYLFYDGGRFDSMGVRFGLRLGM